MIRLGVTGGIGSGKSHVCRMLDEHFGIPVYNCDIRARIITLSEPQVRASLQQLIPGLYDESHDRMDKERLGAYLFASADNARRVNAIVHPAVRADLRAWYASHSHEPLVAMESAILYESGFDSEVERVLFVDAPLELRIRRTCQRDGLSPRQVQQRIDAQRSDEARSRAHFTLLNDGQADLHAQLGTLLDTLLSSPNH